MKANVLLLALVVIQQIACFGVAIQPQLSRNPEFISSGMKQLKPSNLRKTIQPPQQSTQFKLSVYKQKNYFYVVDQIMENKLNYVELTLKLNKPLETVYVNNRVYTQLKVVINCNSWDELSFRITDLKEQRFEVPHREPFPYSKTNSWNSKSTRYEFQVPKVGEQFYFRLIRKQTKEVIFDTSNSDLIFTDKYLEISTLMNQERIYGLGDRRYTSFELGTGKFSFWAADATRIDTGQPNQQLYGHHPMYLRRESKSTNFHVTFLRNTYGMEVDYMKSYKLTYKIIGGIFDFRFFVGDRNPETSINLYHRYVNGYILHPFWVQGYHQSRWGYNSTEKLITVWKTFNSLSLPLDSLWSDIDYMNDYQDFTFNTERFDLNLLKKVFNLQSPDGVHWSSIIDVGIAQKSVYGQEGVNKNVYIMSNMTGQPLVGWVWPGSTYFPDFNNPNTSSFWHDGFVKLQQYGIAQDGIWLDMNEYSNFVNGEIVPSGTEPPETPTFYPFNPLGDENPLSDKSLSLNATHYNGQDAALFNIPNYKLTEYDMHNINGFSEGYATYQVAKQMGKKLTFILSRSTLFGSGRYVQHWTGDNMSTWEYMKLSIPHIFTFQLFSIPLVGDDICGFNGDTNPELCARWFQLGSLYPFTRDHNSINNIDQEPYAFPTYHFVLNSAKRMLAVRYSLLKFYYHLFVRGQGKGTVFRPLFFEFPDDDITYQTEGQFMLGEYLMAAPVLKQGNNSTNTTFHTIYFPQNATFFNFYNYRLQTPGSINFNVPYDEYTPLFIRGGKIVHTQDMKQVVRSNQLNFAFTLLIAFDSKLESTGQMMSIENFDSDENIINNCVDKNCIININAKATTQKGGLDTTIYNISIKFEGQEKNTVFQKIAIKKIILMGLQKQDGQQISKIIDFKKEFLVNKDGATIQQTFTENEKIMQG